MSYSWLPPLLSEIAEVAGLEAALAMADARGGSRVSIPARASDDHWLVVTLGREAADRICAHFRAGYGGSVIDLPLGPSSSANATRRSVDRMIRAGASANQIALAVRVHRSTVFRRKGKLQKSQPGKDQPGKDQPDLFD